MPDHLTQHLQHAHSLFRQHMNGVGAASMRRKGLSYRISYGIPLYELQSIARGFPTNEALALALLAEDIRESKLLAMLLMPKDAFTEEMIDRWLDACRTTELVEHLSKLLLQYIPNAAEWAEKAMTSDERLRSLAGIQAMSAFLVRHPSWRSDYLRQQVEQLTAQYATSGDDILHHAAMNLLSRLTDIE
mgnify:CR=1 FL=1